MSQKQPRSSDAAEDTPSKLRHAAHQVVCETGLAGASARTIAGRAGVNQALIFYHFGTLSGLLQAASDEAIQTSVEYYRSAFDSVTNFDELLQVARALQERERDIGNVAFMAQMLSGSHHDPVLAQATRFAMNAWVTEVEAVLARILATSALTGLVDPAGMARLVCAGFIGIELYDAADPDGGAHALATLEEIGALAQVLDDLGPVARGALRAKTRHLR